MAHPERLNFEEAKNEATDIQRLIGEHPTKEFYQITSEIMDMRKDKLELRKSAKELSALQYLNDKREVVDLLGHNLVGNKDLIQQTADHRALQNMDVDKALEQSFNSISMEAKNGLSIVSDKLDRVMRIRNPAQEDKPEVLQEHLQQLQARLELYRDFKSHGLETMKVLAREVFTTTVQSPEDLSDALTLFFDEIEEGQKRAKTKLEELQNPKKIARWKELEPYEIALKEARQKRDAEVKREAERVLLGEQEYAQRIVERKASAQQAREDKLKQRWDLVDQQREEEERNLDWVEIEGKRFVRVIVEVAKVCDFGDSCERKEQQGMEGRIIQAGEKALYEPPPAWDRMSPYSHYVHEECGPKYARGEYKKTPLLFTPEMEAVKLPHELTQWLEQNPNAVMRRSFGPLSDSRYIKGKDKIIWYLTGYILETPFQSFDPRVRNNNTVGIWDNRYDHSKPNIELFLEGEEDKV